MVEVKFSSQGTGACPICRNYRECSILNYLALSLEKCVLHKKDNVIELVVYRCPEFREL